VFADDPGGAVELAPPGGVLPVVGTVSPGGEFDGELGGSGEGGDETGCNVEGDGVPFSGDGDTGDTSGVGDGETPVVAGAGTGVSVPGAGDAGDGTGVEPVGAGAPAGVGIGEDGVTGEFLTAKTTTISF